MVDEPFPLQRKILKGQLDVRNREVGFNAKKEQQYALLEGFIVIIYYRGDGFYSHVDKVKHFRAHMS